MLKLYDYELSGNCYKVRLLLSILRLDYQRQGVDFYPGREHKSTEFLRINPLGQLPVLVDDELTLADSNAILAYLACKYDPNQTWYPTQHPAQIGTINYWLNFANELGSSAGAARLQQSFAYPFDLETCQTRAHSLLRILDQHLWFQHHQQRNWLCTTKTPNIADTATTPNTIATTDTPTIADIACFPHVILCEEGGISRLDYPAVRLWCDQVKRILNFITTPGVFPTSPARTNITESYPPDSP